MFSPPFESKSCFRVSPAPPLSTGPRRPMASVYEAGPFCLQKPKCPIDIGAELQKSRTPDLLSP